MTVVSERSVYVTRYLPQLCGHAPSSSYKFVLFRDRIARRGSSLNGVYGSSHSGDQCLHPLLSSTTRPAGSAALPAMEDELGQCFSFTPCRFDPPVCRSRAFVRACVVPSRRPGRLQGPARLHPRHGYRFMLSGVSCNYWRRSVELMSNQITPR